MGNVCKWIIRIGLCFFLLAPSAFAAAPGNFSLGVYGGWGWGIASEGVEGYPSSEFSEGPVYGANLMYRFPGGFTMGVSFEQLEMDLKEFGYNYGTLKMNPLMVNFLYQGIPVGGRGFTGHGGIGLGVNFTSFEKGPDIEAVGAPGSAITVDTDEGFVFALYGGLDYFFTRNISMNLDGRFLLGTVDTSWRANGRPLPIGTFDIHSFQLLLGMRLWF